MNRQETTEILTIINLNYKNFFKDRELESFIDSWFDVLQSFEFKDVQKNLKIAMAEERFQFAPPQVYYLTQGLIPNSKKIDFKKGAVFCQRCRRAFKNNDDLSIHFERCSSIDYIARQYKRFNIQKDLNRKELFEMNQDRFDESYDKILEFVSKKTNDANEKTRIGYISNPPQKEKARAFLNGI